MVARKLVFYRWTSINTKPEFVPPETMARLRDAIQREPDFSILDGPEVTTAVDSIAAGAENRPSNLQLLALRTHANRPSQWTPGEKLGPLPLTEEQYPADVTHVSIWPNGIAAQDLHANAPRLGRLSFYLRHKINSFVSFEPLYNPDMFDKLEELRGQLRFVDISMTRPEYLSDNQGVFGTLVPAVFGPRAPSISVRVAMGRYGPRDRYLDEATEETVFAIAEDVHESVERLIVGGRSRATGKVEEVNLLNQRLQVEVDLPSSATIAALPGEEETFRELSNAYEQLQQQDMFNRATQAQVMRSRR